MEKSLGCAVKRVEEQDTRVMVAQRMKLGLCATGNGSANQKMPDKMDTSNGNEAHVTRAITRDRIAQSLVNQNLKQYSLHSGMLSVF